MIKEVAVSNRQRRHTDTLKKRTVVKATRLGYTGEQQDRYIKLAELTYGARKKLPGTVFAIPGKRKYPIHDIEHARNALARVAQFGTPEEKAMVKAAVARRYPQIGKSKKGGK